MKKFKISPSFLLYILAIILLNKLEFLILLIISLFLHELGHIYILKLNKIKIKKLTMFAYGGVMEADIKSNNNCYLEIIIYLAGPIVNLLIAIISYIINFKTLFEVNLLLFIFNILPIYPMDGYHILLNIISLRFNFNHSLMITKYISLVSSLIALVISFFINLYFVVFVSIIIVLNIKNILSQKELEKLCLDKYLYPNYILPKKELKNPNLNIKTSLYKGKLNYILMNNKIYNEKDLLARYYEKSTIS